MRAKDAGMRCRCKALLALVQGTTPTMIALGGLGAKSQVYRVAERFLTEGLAGLADKREDNGGRKITPSYQSEVLRLIEESPQQFGYRRPTWTQELLIVVLAERTGIAISVSAMSRLLSRLGIGLKRPKPIVNCPWKKGHRTRRLRAIPRLVADLPADEVVLYLDEVDIHLNPKIGPDRMKRRAQKEVLTPGCNEKRYLAGAGMPRRAGSSRSKAHGRTACCSCGSCTSWRRRTTPTPSGSTSSSTTTASTTASRCGWH